MAFDKSGVIQTVQQMEADRAGQAWYWEYRSQQGNLQGLIAGIDRWRTMPGFDAEAENLVGTQIAQLQNLEADRDLFGVIPVSRGTYEEIGNIGGGLATIGLAAGAIYAGGVTTGLIGTGEAVTAGTAAAETAAVSGGAAASVSTGAAATAAGATTAGGFWGGITAAGVNSTLGLVNTATNLLRRVGINIGGSSTESRPNAASGGTGDGNSLYPYYLEGTGPSIGGGFGFSGADQAPSETITDYIRAATGGGVWLIVAAALLIGGYFLLKRR